MGDLVVVEEVVELVEVEGEDLEVMVEVVEVGMEVGLDRAVDVGALEEEGAKVLLVEWEG